MFFADDTLDFHNTGPITPYDVEIRLTEFIEDCHIKRHDQVLIITGKGLNSPEGAKVRPQIQKLLKQNKYVKSFKFASVYNGGRGAFEVQLVD